jgi:chloramphenicol-sensitive protein RarD
MSTSSAPASNASTSRDARLGVLCAVSAYLVWGLVPLYFKAVADVSALEIIAHRVVWSALLMAGILLGTRNVSGIKAVLASPGILVQVGAAALLVSSNWLVFVWAVNADRVLETSLGYYILPLFNVLLGAVFLGERLRPLQMLAVGLAACGVLNQIFQLGQLPWVSLVLAVTFGFYGLLRKRILLDALNGLFFETALLTPVALLYLRYLGNGSNMAFLAGSANRDLLIVASGVVTAVPLVLFAAGARRLRLMTMGVLQYLAPTLTFLLAVLVYDERFEAAQIVTFILIWAGLAIYTLDVVAKTWAKPESGHS